VLLLRFVGVLVRRVFRVWEYLCLCKTFISVTMRNINILLGGSFSMKMSDRLDPNRFISENLFRRDK